MQAYILHEFRNINIPAAAEKYQRQFKDKESLIGM
jgi:hypothetical protein